MGHTQTKMQVTRWVTASLISTIALYQGLITRSHTVRTRKWKYGAHMRFVVVADLHSVLFGVRQQDLLREIRRLQPDCILMPGDIVDEHRPPVNAWYFLREAGRMAPAYYVPGNHEYRTRCMPAVLDMIRRCGITLLLDKYVRLDCKAGPLIIAGCEDPEKTVYDSSYNATRAAFRSFGEMDQEYGYMVLMAHRPERAELYTSLGFDLVVSGHAHGGQARIPRIVNGLYAPEQGILPKRAGGCYTDGKTTHVVSRGLAVYPGVPRVFNPPEIVAVDVVGVG